MDPIINKNNIEDAKTKLFEYINSEAEPHGHKVVDIHFKPHKTVSIEIIIDKDGGVTIGECTRLNKKVEKWIDDNNMFTGGYIVDVCSPGLDRVLKSDNEFAWAVGKNIEVFLHEPVNGKTNFSGILSDFEKNDGKISIKQESNEVVFLMKNNITKARLKAVL